LLIAVYSANFRLHLSRHLTRHAASANQGGRGMSPPNMDLFKPPASWCTCAALTMVVAYFQVYEEVRCKS
ncbi:mCG66665, partial [Mus musculus]